MPTLAAEWETIESEETVTLSVTGDITYGERQRFMFRRGECKFVYHVFSNYTEQPMNFSQLKGTVFAIHFNGEFIGAELIGSSKVMLGHLLMFNLGVYDKDILLNYLNENDTISIRLVDGNNIKASDYFDMPYNEWDISGITKAFDDAYKTCIGET